MSQARQVVLVADDHPENVALVSTNLELEDYVVETAADGAEAVRKALDTNPDLILLDIMMPVMDGLEACREIRRNPRTRRTPIIMLTAKGRVEDIVAGLDCGADDYIKKPFQIVELLGRVRAALRLKSAQDELSELHRSLEQRVEERTRELTQSQEELRANNAMMAEALEREKRMAAQLDIEREKAEAAAQAKSAFLANMSHEIRSPMTAILGFVDLIGEGCQKSCSFGKEQCAEYIRTIGRNGHHLLHLINDILDLSKVEAGKVAAERVRCMPGQIVADVASLMRERAAAKNLTFDVEYHGPLPETILSDPTRLRQILINLIGNAVKFTETGGVRLVARLVEGPGVRGSEGPGGQGVKGPSEAGAPPASREASAFRPLDPSARQTLGPFLQFDVIDTGIGMTPEQSDSLFRPFTQADISTTRRFGGTGLGLSISKRLAKMLGGNITVTSRAGGGSTFRVTIATGPLDGVRMIDRPVEALATEPQASAATKSEAAPLDCRILLAEDGVDNQRLISFILTKAGAAVDIAENGKLAVEKALGALYGRREDDPVRPYDVILMDMQMPVMGGYEAAGLLRAKGYTGPIIALTAHAMASDREKCISAGCDDYVAKPIDRKHLIKTIRQHTGVGPAAPAAEPVCSQAKGD